MHHPDSRVHRLPLAAAALAATAFLGACGGGADDASLATATPTPTASSSIAPSAMPSPSASPSTTAMTTSSTPSLTVPAEPPPSATPAEFDVAMVRSNEINKVDKGGQANVHVVAGLLDTQALLDVANGCVQHYLTEQQAAFCHVWATEANYAARDPENVGDLLCWTHYVGVPLAGGPPLVTTSESYELEVWSCPDITG